MIERLRITDLGVITDAEVALHPGLNVVTGETGAGKTMVMTGLGLLLGRRADPALVRQGRAAARVEGVVHAPKHLAERVREVGGSLDDDELVLARTVAAEGRSRAHLGGATVPVSILSEVGEQLVAVHGQADQYQLRSPARQRDMLDRFAGTELVAAQRAVAEEFAIWLAGRRALKDRRANQQERQVEADALRYGLREVAAVAPVAGEDAELAAEADRLAHADALRAAVELAHMALVGEPLTDVEVVGSDGSADVATLLATASRALADGATHDAALGELGDRVAEAGVSLSDVSADLASYAAGLETDPQRLQLVHERRAALAALTRRHGPTLDDVLAWAKHAEGRLVELDDSDEALTTLHRGVQQAERRLAEAACGLSALRRAAADDLGWRVTQEVRALAMPHAEVSVLVQQSERPDGLPLPDGRTVAVDEFGVDEVSIVLRPNPGAPALPVQRGASGGELSRVMLALEAVLAQVNPVRTFVFDEVDAGVGGEAAIDVGRRLARLAEHRQVVVVTHLPQVAAFADRHLVVRRSADGSVGGSDVQTLHDDERPAELARMLAGLADSDLGRAHATELLDLTARTRDTRSAVPPRTASREAG